jgi:hypothetical protein
MLQAKLLVAAQASNKLLVAAQASNKLLVAAQASNKAAADAFMVDYAADIEGTASTHSNTVHCIFCHDIQRHLHVCTCTAVGVSTHGRTLVQRHQITLSFKAGLKAASRSLFGKVLHASFKLL